uniref:Protein misato homolog 1 n=1 Tax=Gouania willdenowi TaxID=441366 RepID=A0A8C5HMY5_GOUWI
MSVCREVITLQLGHYSNYVGTHWWNLQDASLSYDPEEKPGEIQSDVVFREGQTQGGHVTYTPRLIAVDLKGNAFYFSAAGVFNLGVRTPFGVARHWEEILMVPFLCSGSLSMDTVNSRLQRVQHSYRLEGSVKVWSDFLRIHLHPRTISIIHQYNHDGEAHRLEAFSQGESLLQGAVLDELEDKLHFFVEECDYLQGFQVLCDMADGFAGFGSKVTEMLQDSYSGRGILTWGTAPVSYADSTPVKDIYHLLNCTLATVHMANNSSFFCPLTLRGGLGRRPSSPVSFPHLSYDPSLWFHSSSVLALALDALTVSYRLRDNSVPMWQLADTLAVSGRKVVAAYGAVPFPMMHGSSLPDTLSSWTDAPPWKPLSACSEMSDGRCYGQWATLRGYGDQSLISALPPGTPPTTILHSLPSGEDVLGSYIRSFYPTSPLALQLLATPSKLTPPYPQIFSPQVDAQVSSVPVLTSLQSNPALQSWLSELHRSTSTLDIRRVAPSFLSQGLESSDYDEALEQLRVLARCYRDDSGGVMRSSSEEEDD